MSSCAVSNESVVKTMIVSPILFLTSEDWFEDYSVCKYQLVHLTVDDPSLSIIDIFMLAASRLGLGGELIVRFNAAFSSISFPTFFVSLGRSFGFEAIASTYNSSSQFSFRFNGPETKLGYQMQLAQTVSDRCIALFKDVFGHAISKEFWNWKYPRDSEPHSVIALQNNQVVAHYGLCDRLAAYNNSTWEASQACDVMVALQERGAISSSVFYELVKIGERPFYGSNSTVSFIYGFPHGRHFKLGARLKLYTPISPIFEVVFEIPSRGVLSDAESSRIELVVVNSSVKSSIEAVLELMFSVPDTLLLKRDYLYLLHRYAHHPEYDYKIYRFEGCYFIIKPTADRIFLMDYLGELNVYAEKLNAFILYLSEIYPSFALHLWCLEDIAASFINPKQVVNTGAFFVYKRYSDSLPDFKRWWISMGDTEFL